MRSVGRPRSAVQPRPAATSGVHGSSEQPSLAQLRAVAYNTLMGTPRRPRLERRNTVNTLESSRFKVVLDKVCNGRLDRYTVDSVRPGKTATRAAS